jgi:glycosyltransferase involved in cell wall biosynthesis
MKVLVVNNAVPFIRGGAEELADNLVRRLNATPGVQAESLRVPFNWEPRERLIEEILINQAFSLWNVDRVIGLKFPAYLIPHDNKVLWLLHQFRQAYDLDVAGQSHLGDDEQGRTIKRAIHAADKACFEHSRRIFCNSPVTQGRLKRFNGFDSEVLYPPLNDGELFTGGEAGDYVFAGGRVDLGKRQHLLIEAVAKTKGSFRLVIAGPLGSAEYGDRLRALVEQYGLESRVELAFGFHPRADIARWVNGARACAYLPFDEDSVGYVTMEAFAAAKPMITVTDSGGLLEIVDADTGAVVEPDAQALADAMDRLMQPAAAARAGQAARALWTAKDVTWERTIEMLIN